MPFHPHRFLAILLMLGSCSLGAISQVKPPATFSVVPRSYLCSITADVLTIDGILDEPAWREAPWTEDFGDIEGNLRPVPRYRTHAKMRWDSTCLYIGAELLEPNVWATLRQRDTVIFYDNDFEVFLDPDGDTHAYGELEMNALNTVWDLFLPKSYKDGGKAEDGWNIEGLKTAVHVAGTLNDPMDTDRGWSVEIALPWRALGALRGTSISPPGEGDSWRINFSRVEWQTDILDGHTKKRAGKPEDNWVWSPQWVVDMHRPEMWGYLQFTSRKPGEGMYHADPGWAQKATLMEIYYAQRAYREAHGMWAGTMEELAAQLPRGAVGRFQGVILENTPEGYWAILARKGASPTVTYRVRQDSRLDTVTSHEMPSNPKK